MEDDAVLKERAIFFLDRRIGELDASQADHVAMADSSVSYAERRRVEANFAEKRDKNKTERDALQWARNKLMEV